LKFRISIVEITVLCALNIGADRYYTSKMLVTEFRMVGRPLVPM
jgi:hypothetical protein